MPPRAAKILFYYDIVSPYSRFAFECLQKYKHSVWGDRVDIDYIPFLLGGVMKLSQNIPPGSNPLKAKYLRSGRRTHPFPLSGDPPNPLMNADIELGAKHFQVPMVFPPTFPANTITAQRLLTAIKRQSPAHLEEATRQLWTCYWQDEKDITNVGVVTSCLERVFPSTEVVKAMIKAAQETEIKEALEVATREAVESGAFGAPWMIVCLDGEEGQGRAFFGSDRFEVLSAYLGEPYCGPVPSHKHATSAKL